jgi:Second Messenger Oligonucleotide or Dinucleotide Synthetase domain
MTVTEAFNIFKGELELPDRKQKQASDAQQAIRLEIAKHLYVPNSFLTGSYFRYTKIFPLNDVDVMLVRNENRVSLSTDGRGIQPNQALDEVAEAIGKVYGIRATIKKQSRSVNVRLPGLDFGFDLTPAWLRSPDGYWIPDTDSSSWIATNPDTHADLMTRANKRCHDILKPVIKMVKHWSRNNNDDLIRSFHIELICARIFSNAEIVNYPMGIATVLVNLPDYIGKVMMDPVYGQSRVDKVLSLEEHKKVLDCTVFDGGNAIEALKLENAGREKEAVEKWKYIFISGFPR